MSINRIRQALQLRRRLKKFGRSAARIGSRLLLSSRMRDRVLSSPSNVLLLSVYRHQNISTLLPIVLEARKSKWDVRLWALDRVHPSLESFSVGGGAGSKFSLLNALLKIGDWSNFDWIIVCDDDAILENGSLAVFLELAEQAELSLAQPAHGDSSHRSHDISLWVPFSIARLTTFVEIGPIFAVHRSLSHQILPFPEECGMGWGLDIRWSDLTKDGARLGIIDLITIRHLVPVANQYRASIERERTLRLLEGRALKSIIELQHTLSVWRPWQRHAPWAGRWEINPHTLSRWGNPLR